MSEQAKALVREWAEVIWNQGRLDKLGDYIAEDHVVHDPQFPEMRGIEPVREIVSSFRAAVPDVQVTIDQAIGEGDFVAERFSMRGTHQGELMGIAPTGKAIIVTGMVWYRFAGGKIIEQWANWDALGLLQQIGAVPGPTNR